MEMQEGILKTSMSSLDQTATSSHSPKILQTKRYVERQMERHDTTTLVKEMVIYLPHIWKNNHEIPMSTMKESVVMLWLPKLIRLKHGQIRQNM
jgi:hypothetical protein